MSEKTPSMLEAFTEAMKRPDAQGVKDAIDAISIRQTSMMQDLLNGAVVKYNNRPVMFRANATTCIDGESLVRWTAEIPAIVIRGRVIFADAIRTRRYLRKFARKARLIRQNRCKR